MSDDEWEGPDGGDLNELDADAARFEATHDGADWTDEPQTARPFVVGDRVLAGWKMLGCDMDWWQGTGAITEIEPADEYDGQALPPLAYVEWDRLVPMPCTHDHWHEGETEVRRTVIPLTADHTASAHPTVKRIELAPTDVEPEPCGVTGEDPDECDCSTHRASESDARGFPYGARVMWSHGRGVAGTVYPRDEWPYPDDLTRYPGDIFVRWEDGATTLVAPAALTRTRGVEPVPYTAAEFSDPAPF